MVFFVPLQMREFITRRVQELSNDIVKNSISFCKNLYGIHLPSINLFYVHEQCASETSPVDAEPYSNEKHIGIHRTSPKGNQNKHPSQK